MAITVVGLGPGPYELLTLAAARILESARMVRLRTARHPTVDAFPEGIRWTSFDSLYDRLPDFEAVYSAIVDALLAEALGGNDVVYAVPGDPSLGEASVTLLRTRAADAKVPCLLVPGVSFIGPALLSLTPSAIGSLQLRDALQASDFDPTTPLLAYQVYGPNIANDLKLELLRRYPAQHPVFVVSHAGAPAEQTIVEVPLEKLDRLASFDHLTAVFVPELRPEEATASMQGLRAIIRRLRGPGGCPWDREQTHASIRQYVIEEAYEVADAIDAHDPNELREELADLLLQVLLHAQIADDGGDFDFDDVIQRLGVKLVGRHPHVFGDAKARSAEEVVRNWELLKRAEKGEQGRPASALDGIPRSMPSLRAAQETYRRTAEAGVAIEPDGRLQARLATELERLRATTEEGRRARALGGVVLATARLATAWDVDLETAVERALASFSGQFRRVESDARHRGIALSELAGAASTAALLNDDGPGL